MSDKALTHHWYLQLTAGRVTKIAIENKVIKKNRKKRQDFFKFFLNNRYLFFSFNNKIIIELQGIAFFCIFNAFPSFA